MNKHFTFITAIVLLFSLRSYGQAYTFSTAILPYNHLSGATPITQADPQGGGFYFSYDLKFKTFNTESNFLANGQTSAGAFVANDGYVAVYNAPGETHTVIYQALLLEGTYGLVKRPTSQMSYKYEGTPGSGTLKMEWKNMGIDNRHDSEYVCVQVWLNEADESITYHYGPRNISTPVNFFASVVTTLNTQFGIFDNAINVTGDANAPTTSVASSFATMPNIIGLPGVGRVYMFRRKSSGINDLAGAGAVKAYPVPARETLTIEVENKAVCSVTDVTGKIVLETYLQAGINTISTTQLTTGMYYLNVSGESGNTIQKITVVK